ncbi:MULTISPECIES: methylation-associated defense system restriction endonuclease subunit S MAD5 [unclassified Streptomyces]|uniref:methylation-associated defense system restriction endonuclease subunit S MAD5 n=1 Tax=unclassified Streptomyces TaxID=2593676 RepID=UPI000F76D919|nr:restriction endonuclease subunit S [Streptomyces sp. WAC08241]RSS46959.1 restriction endonuclease subunit S [Streptomyces sp. WAC08241]
MKLVNTDNPVRAGWLIEQSTRLDATPYLSGAYEARKLLERLPVPKEPLHHLTRGHDGGIFNGPKFRRVYMSDTKYGVPFMGSTDMLEADLSWLPYLRKKDAEKLSYLEIEPGMTLISCSGTVGRTAYVRTDMAGIWSSQHVMKVNPDKGKILPGYLNAFLQSRYGIPIIVSQASGSIIQHIEASHLTDLPVPRFEVEIEERIHELIQAAADLRAGFQRKVRAATEDLFESAGLAALANLRWYEMPRPLGFEVKGINSTSLRALNHDERAREISDLIREVPHALLGEICEGGELERGHRFKRIDVEGENGIPLVGQRQVFWVRPVERRIALKKSERMLVQVDEGTVLVASQGLLTENALIGRAAYVSDAWREKYAFSEHFLRVRPEKCGVSGEYLFAYMRSDVSFRVMRSLCVGTGPQDIHAVLRRQVPIPLCPPADRERIANTVRSAYRDRDEADRLEDEALRLLDEAVRDAAR